MNVEVISKATGAVTEVASDAIDLNAPSIVRLDITRAQVAGFEREGHDLIIRLVDGDIIRVADFYPPNADIPNDLVLREDDGSLWLARTSAGSPRFSMIHDLDDLLAGHGAGGGSSIAIPAILGGLVAAGGIAALASGGGDNDARPSGGQEPDPGTGTPAPDREPPAAPTGAVRGDGGAVLGRGEPGATVSIRNAAGAVIGTAVVATDGSYTAAVSPAQVNGERLTVTQADAAGNVSPATPIQAPDITAPTAPTAAIDAAGTTITGRGEAGATVTVRDASGAVLGSAVVAADGTYAVTLSTPQTNGQTLSISQADAAGNVSPVITTTAPDITAPTAPTAAVAGDGAQVIGRGEPGATVTIRNAGGAILATAIVGADGAYAATLSPAQRNGEALSVSQADAAGNVSPSAAVIAPDLTAPTAPSATIGADGTNLSGRGEAGARVDVRDASGTVIGSAIVAADGSYTVVLAPAQTNGGTVSVTQSDAAGNVSPATSVAAPDITAPAAPVAAINGDGTIVTGTGEPGGRVTVTDAGGTPIGTAIVGADGSYSIILSTPQANGGTLSIVQTDPAGNVSPTTSVAAPDITAPAAPAAAINGDGTIVTGTGEAGGRVTVTDAAGTPVGTAIVAADGSYSITLSTPQANGGTLSIVQTDPAGNASPATSVAAPDITAPAAPVATINGDGTIVAGTGEAGGRVTVTDAAGTPVGTAIVAADGSYSVTLTTPQANGGTLSIVQTDPAGNASPATSVAAPDITAPAAPVATINGDGTVVTGIGEPGGRVVVTDASGTPLGTATVAADGSFTATLSPPQADGQALSATQTDTAGNVSAPTGIVAPDITGPAAPTITIDATGTQASGSGQAGARVTITDPAGSVIGTAIVSAAGSYTATLTTPQVNGERIDARQSDASGNPSGIASAIAPDLTAPAQPTAAINADGSVVTGAGEPGARITVTDSAGTVLGDATVATDGSYSATLVPAQANGEALTVIQADAAGNAAPPLPLIAPDITAPLAPVATLDATGTVVSGTGEPGARISVRDATGAEIGTATIGAQGGYAVVLATSQVNSQTLTVIQSDAAGNASPAATLTAPDLTAPGAPTGVVSADGTSIAGTGEPGATVIIRNPLGAVIATTTVAADGSYGVVLSPAQVDGEALVVRQADAAGNVSPPATAIAPDLIADSDPAAPTAAVSADGAAVAGVAIGGATITLYDANGAVIGSGVANADGSYSVALTPPRIDGETVRVTQTEADGDVSPPATAVAPDLTAPAAPVAALNGTGGAVIGTGEAGATVTVRAADGSTLGTGVVAANGAFAVILAAPQANGGTLSVTQADTAGNVSPATSLAAPDLTAPGAPAATVSADGSAVTGTGEPGTTATVRDAAGVVIGSATVAADGSYAVPLTPVQANGETVSVTLADATGNVSPPTNAVAPDITAPAAPTATVTADGATVAGTGEPGATITVTAPGGAVIGTTVIGASGSYAVAISPAQANGETVSVAQSDAAGNASPATTVTAPDITAPAAPTAAISGDGATVTGTGEAGATVTITNPAGAAIGSALVAADGNYSVTLTPAQANGGTLSVAQSDPAGNASPAVPLAAPDITAPAAPTLVLGGDGTSVTGTGEPGATITITGPAGTAIGSAVVAADGSYTATISPALVNGEQLGATQADAAGNVSGSASAFAPDLTAPVAPTAAINGDGTLVTGTGEPGATVTITGPAGTAVGTAPVAADGSYAVTLSPAQANGEALTVTQSDAAGNASPTVGVTAPDITAPAAPTAIVSGDGASVSGTGEAGATIRVVGPAGTTIGTAIVAANGTYTATLAPAQANGEALSVVQADTAGNVSPATGVSAPDITAPAAPTAIVSGDGTTVTGTGEAGATVTITNPAGAAIGSAVVAANGSYTATLTPAQTNGERLGATQADAAGNASGSTSTIAPDLTAPVAPTATIAGDGTSVTGTGEAGATVTIRGPGGTAIGTAIVAADGSYTATLTPAQANGEALSVVQADGAGNISPVVPLTAPDITAPPAPVAILDATGAIVTGTGEAGATVTVRDAGGATLGTAAVNAKGAYTITLATPQVNSQALAVVQTDAAGNASPQTPLTAPDLTAPAAPTAVVAPDGVSLSGIGEAGATVTVRSPLGATIGTAVVATDGSYTVTLTTSQTDGETLSVTQADPAGNVSPATAAVAPDLVVDSDPAAPTATVGPDGAAVAGVAIGGATITVYNATGVVIATGTANSDGSYSVALVPAQTNGETVRVTQTEADGDVSPPATAVAPDLTAPAAPTATLDATGGVVTGTGEPGATITVRGPGGLAIGTATVNAGGSYAATLTPAQTNGEALSVTQADAAGNVSPPLPLIAPDFTAPTAPLVGVAPDGTSVAGSGEPGTVATVSDGTGAVIGIATVAPDGSYTVPLTVVQANGQTVSVTLTDAAGNVSPPATAVAPDITAPAAPTAAITADGTGVTGTGEAGATVSIVANGVVVGTAVVAANGSYAATLTPAQANGEALSVTQADAAGNASPATGIVAPDITAPAAPVVTIAADGASLTGTGEPGASVTVRDGAGAVVGTTVVAVDGTFTATLAPPQANGGTLAVVQADAAGNPSPATPVAAPDITAPAAPVVAIGADGTTASGTGEPGATVTITGAGGVVLGTALVAADGSYAAALAPTQNNGQPLSATQADVAGNVSAPALVTAPDLVAPIAPTATVSPDGTTVTGIGEAGARIVILDPAGAAIGVATVAADGRYSATLSTPQVDGERLTATQTDGGGNASPPVVAVAPDLTAPAIPTLVIATDGSTASGSGEAGATITLTGPGGTVVATTQVAADGSYTIALVPPRVNGEAFTATQADAAGNASPAASALAPDLTAPAAPSASVDGAGTTVTGTGEAGATVRVTGPGGALGSAVVAADGSYTVALTTPQANGQALVVTQTDAAGNVSPDTGLTAPDITAPAAPSAIVAGDGASVSGIGEAGATVTITAPGGAVIGTALVAADGSYTAVLTVAQTNGELLGASQRDAAGNPSPVAPALAPDTTAPGAPTATISGDGGVVSGNGEPGATVTVTAPGGGILGTATVTAAGSYTVTLSQPQTDGQTLGVTQADRAGNISPPASVLAPDSTSPLSPTATVTGDGAAVVGTGIAGDRITVTSPAGTTIGTTIVRADGTYTVTLDVPQRNGELLGVVQADTAGNASPPIAALAPDLTAPAAPTATVGGDGAVVTGIGEAGATVTITGPGNAILGTAIVGSTGSYLVTLSTPQRNGEALVATQQDAAGNVSAPGNAVAPDLTAPPPPAGLVVAGDGTTLTGTGEAGARVEVRGSGGVLLGTTTVAADGSFTVALSPLQVTGATVSVTQADVAGNVSGPATAVAPFDIQAFGNTDTASIDLVPVTTSVNAGTANYLALVSLGVLNLQAQVLAVPSVQFNVAAGHSLDATFTYDGLATLGVAAGYSVIVQRFDGTNWVAVSGAPGSSLLELGLLGGNLVATETLGPGNYRAFVTFQGAAGLGVLGALNVTGRDADFTAAPSAVPATDSGNVITDPGPGGAVDVVSAATRVDSVTHNGVVTTLTGNGTVVDGDWGTLVINTDGSYTYTPDANAAAIGKTDVFTYTLIDPSDNERESASLSITIGSGDITGAPVAANDVAAADVTYRNVEVVTPPATAFAYNTNLAGGSGGSAFTVAANTQADVTITARTPGLALLPTYTLEVRDAGVVVRTITSVAVASLGNATATFTLDDLPSGSYTYTVTSPGALVGYPTTVALGTTTTFLTSFEVATRETVQGNLFANDTTNTPFAAVHVNSGSGFAEVGDTPVVLTGQHGTLTVNETGGYTYQPSATLAYSTVDLFDTFTYHLVQPNGATSIATLTVTIDVPGDGPAAGGQVSIVQFAAQESDVIALDSLTAHAAAIVPAPEGAAVSLAAYDLFEGKGDLEDVLTHYLAAHADDQSAALPVTEHPVMVMNSAMPTIADPLDYLATSPDDQDRHGITTNHVV